MLAKGNEGDFFRKLAAEGHYGKTSVGTRQGTYLASPTGKLLASGNEQKASATIKLLDRGLNEWNKLAKADRLPTKIPELKNKSKSRLPENGLVFDVSLRKMFPRDLRDTPVDPKIVAASGLPANRMMMAKIKPETYWEVEWNQDHAWLSQEEAKKFLPAKLQQGQTVVVDKEILVRIVRLHMLDTVRALADYYPVDCVKDVELKSSIQEINEKEQVISIRFEGSTHLKQTGIPVFARTVDQTSMIPKKSERSYEAKILGQAKYDLKNQKFTEFELLSYGKKTGGSKLSPFDDTMMGVLFSLSKPSAFDALEPRYFSQYGW